MKVVRGGLLGVAAAAALLGAGCSAASPSVKALSSSAPSSSAPSSVATSASPPAGAPASSAQTATTAARPAGKPADVDVAVVTALSATSVTWIDAQRVPGADESGYVTKRLAGASHVHTVALASNVIFYTVFDAQGEVQMDKDGVGTVVCATPECKQDFTKAVVNNDLHAPRITFDDQGKVHTIAARYHP